MSLGDYSVQDSISSRMEMKICSVYMGQWNINWSRGRNLRKMGWNGTYDSVLSANYNSRCCLTMHQQSYVAAWNMRNFWLLAHRLPWSLDPTKVRMMVGMMVFLDGLELKEWKIFSLSSPKPPDHPLPPTGYHTYLCFSMHICNQRKIRLYFIYFGDSFSKTCLTLFLVSTLHSCDLLSKQQLQLNQDLEHNPESYHQLFAGTECYICAT